MDNKHVIFLGAGASFTSGYPVADQLTILMCDRDYFMDSLEKALRLDRRVGDYGPLKAEVSKHFEAFSRASLALRMGNFRTMDELSALAFGGRHDSRIRELKRLMRFVLALTNPDHHAYPKSDYRHFIQELFNRDATIRSDVSVLSFNYDSFFEWDLLQSLFIRAPYRRVDAGEIARLNQATTSGFLRPADLSWLKQPGFCHLKLHGTSAFPERTRTGILRWPPQAEDGKELSTGHLFGLATQLRFNFLMHPDFAPQDPPALLPWEIVHDDGRLLSQSEFAERVGSDWAHLGLYELFKGIWERAREEVQNAARISFVGLSLGSFMEPELKYLFQGKAGKVHFVVANRENRKFEAVERQERKGYVHPRSPRGRAANLVHRIAPQIQIVCSPSESSREAYMTARSDFADFIYWEMS